MSRYHFTIGGKPGSLGLRGIIEAPYDDAAIIKLQRILVRLEGHGAKLGDLEPAHYDDLAVTTNAMIATMAMFDSIDDVAR